MASRIDGTILVFNQGYLPGFKHGGPVRTLANLFDRLGDEFRFRLVTSDRDSGDDAPYPGIPRDRWVRVGNVDVFYASRASLRARRLLGLVRDARPAALYLNSFFSPAFTLRPILLRRLGFFRGVPVIVAPRGELSPGALGLKWPKKRAYLTAARSMGLYSHVIWQASSREEAAEIGHWFGADARIVVAPNIPARETGGESSRGSRIVPDKVPGALRIVFLSRIARKKNLVGALGMLGGLDGCIHFDIYGPIEDATYWSECRRVAERLPASVQVRYRGPVPPSEVGRVFASYDLFLFPTLGENYGHVIIEALRAGCPVLLSDRTPWRGLAAEGAGWDVPLDDGGRFREILQELVRMDSATHARWSRGAQAYAERILREDGAVEGHRALFRLALGATEMASRGGAAHDGAGRPTAMPL
ncbi:MAG TPA: glycosyltransferase [Longimicrobiales bacterium]